MQNVRSVALQGLQAGASLLQIATQGFIAEHRCIIPVRVATQGFVPQMSAMQIALQGLVPCGDGQIVVPPAVDFLPYGGPLVKGRKRKVRKDRDDDVLLFLLR